MCTGTSGEEMHVVDLYIDGDALASTRTTLENIREVLCGTTAVMASMPQDITGNEQLRAGLVTFGKEWEHGIDKLAEAAGNGAEGLALIAEGFADLDAGLADVLRSGGGGDSGPVPEVL